LRRTVDLTPDERYQILGEIEAEMKASNEGNAERWLKRAGPGLR